MHNDPAIQQYIESALRGSGLPIERRGEVGEELLTHLDALIDQQLAAGRSDADAINDALERFGPAARVRRRLWGQQWSLDLRYALRRTGRESWMPVACATIFTCGAAWFSRSSEAVLVRLGALTLFAALLSWIIAPIFAYFVFERRIVLARPREEFHFSRSLLRWLLLVTVGSGAYLAMGVAMIGLSSLVLQWATYLDPTEWFFWYGAAAALQESALHIAAIGAPAIAGFALSLALFERSRCANAEPSE